MFYSIGLDCVKRIGRPIVKSDIDGNTIYFTLSDGVTNWTFIVDGEDVYRMYGESLENIDRATIAALADTVHYDIDALADEGVLPSIVRLVPDIQRALFDKSTE